MFWYLPSQLQTLVAIVIPVVHLVLPLSEDDSAHHHRQVHTLRPEVKLLHLEERTHNNIHQYEILKQLFKHQSKNLIHSNVISKG